MEQGGPEAGLVKLRAERLSATWWDQTGTGCSGPISPASGWHFSGAPNPIFSCTWTLIACGH